MRRTPAARRRGHDRRIDDEWLARAEDHRIGRLTVEIDDGRVTSIVLEAEGGPITVE